MAPKFPRRWFFAGLKGVPVLGGGKEEATFITSVYTSLLSMYGIYVAHTQRFKGALITQRCTITNRLTKG